MGALAYIFLPSILKFTQTGAQHLPLCGLVMPLLLLACQPLGWPPSSLLASLHQQEGQQAARHHHLQAADNQLVDDINVASR